MEMENNKVTEEKETEVLQKEETMEDYKAELEASLSSD